VFEKLITEYGANPEVSRAVERLGNYYRSVGRHEKAGELYRYVLAHWPDSRRAIWAKMGLVMSHIQAWDLAGAEAELGKLLSRFSAHNDLAAVVHEIVEEYRNTGAHEEGRELFNYLLDEWVASGETMLELQVGVALQSIKLGELDKADAAVESVIADHNDNPNLAKALFQIAEEHFYANNYEKTIELLELILSDYPERWFDAKSESPYVLATCYKHVREFDKAIEHYRRTLEKYPNSRYAPRVPYQMGWIFALEKKDYDKAIYWFEQQRNLYPEDAYSQIALFHIESLYVHDLQDYQKGAEVCQQYIKEYPEGWRTWGSLSNLALCHEKLGNKEEAIRVLRQAYEKAETEGLRTSTMERIIRLEEGGAK